jgi:hypothetical protein
MRPDKPVLAEAVRAGDPGHRGRSRDPDGSPVGPAGLGRDEMAAVSGGDLTEGHPSTMVAGDAAAHLRDFRPDSVVLGGTALAPLNTGSAYPWN